MSSRLPRPAPAPPDAMDLLTRLLNLVSLGIAHCDLHPESYQTPTGRLFCAAIMDEARRIFRRTPPDESTF